MAIPNPPEDDDEWEYEYSTTETTSYYIPIDLSNVPSAQILPNQDYKPGHPTLLKSRLRAFEASRGQGPSQQNQSADVVATDSNADARGDADANGDADAEGDAEDETNTADDAATLGEIQVTGLHTENPLVVYNGQLLSCHWASTIGTDMYFVKAEKEGEEVLKKLNGVDLLGLGTAKLVAKQGQLRPKDEVVEAEVEGVAGAAGDGASTGAPVVQGMPDFLTRLNKAKAKRGEGNRLVVKQTPQGPQLVTEPAYVLGRAESGSAAEKNKNG